jgi:hypothetical protein
MEFHLHVIRAVAAISLFPVVDTSYAYLARMQAVCLLSEVLVNLQFCQLTVLHDFGHLGRF